MVGSFSSPFMPVSDLYINNQVVSKIEVASETIVPFQLYPNPTRDGRVNIDHVFNTAGECEVFLYDIDGRLISRQTELVVVGLNYLNLHYQGLSSGGYFVQLSDGGVTVTKMFFVQ
ncbi:T9SS type A sorting domain-containing protein [Lewinella cohaerens]|uniref:T9SS type A sorting domain-containing protein n=1 Tax=Lewinella cohaerens TaxID=70995 RepID=UPI00316AEC14